MFQTQEKLVCFRCGRLPQQFVVLGCSHPICTDCYGQIDKSQQFKGNGCECDKYSSMRSSSQVVGSSLTLKEYMPTMQSPQINNEEDYIVGGSTTLASGSSSIRKDMKDSPVIRRKNAPKREKPISNFQLPDAKRRIKTEQPEEEERISGRIYGHRKVETMERGQQTVNVVNQKDQLFSSQLDFIEAQYNKAIEQIKLAVEAKLKQFSSSFELFRQGLVQWYINVAGGKDRSHNINVAKLVRQRYSQLDDQLQSFRDDVFDFQIKVDQLPSFYKARQENDLELSQQKEANNSNSNVYIINRPWIVDNCPRPRYLSPSHNQCPGQFKTAASKLRKQTLKNMDFIDGLLSRNRMRRWCSGSKIIL